ncbi:MAG: zinc-dependent metalloprotease [Deltaproteobacteria bacterium]|nr:zinc-dependent metalloprotease [Deltaproteobacteria bacterium]
MRRIHRLMVVLTGLSLFAVTEPAEAKKSAAPVVSSSALPTVASVTTGLERRAGLLDVYLDPAAGKLWLQLPAPGRKGEVGRYLYVEALSQGMGSNPVGLDRGQLGDTRLVRLRRLGGRLLMEVLNTRFRAESPDEAERLAVEESFATSVLWAGPVGAEDADGSFLVDFTSFVLRDAHQVSRKLKARGQGSYSFETQLSAVDLEACLAFPDNVELEGLLTFALKGDEAGAHVFSTVPAAQAISLTQHHSLIRLPDDGYRPRVFHAESGFSPLPFQDYGQPLDAALRRLHIPRHRLTKTDPTAELSPVVEPIVFYLDPGTPEPVRSALLDGAGWWAKAFEAAGFEDAFRVEMLPPGAHPLDVRYNVIQWVHRSTRGWSYGGGVIDPRTGEILKGHVTLGSLRVRQDRLLFEGLLGVENTGSGRADDPVELALARLRQLAAHEVGHALGIAHNFAASTYGRASVMDYPAPLIEMAADGGLDVSRAYGVGVGAWDLQAVRYGYTVVPEEREDIFLASVLQENRDRGLLFLSDEDARLPGAAQPLGNLWDNGADPVQALEQSMAVRSYGLQHFGLGNLAEGQPLAFLQEVLAPVYFHHRFQVDAAAKVIGGLSYGHAHRGDGRPPAAPISPEDQRRGLEVLLGTLEPRQLDIPEGVLALLLPRPFGSPPNRELFAGQTAPTFDPLAAAASAADLTVRALLQRERAARLMDFHRRDPRYPGFQEVVRTLIDRTFYPSSTPELRHRGISQRVQGTVVTALVDLASDRQAAPAVRAEAEAALERLGHLLGDAEGEGKRAPEVGEAAHRRWLAGQIRRYLQRPHSAAKPAPAPLDPPPGSPIGGGGLPAWWGGC